MSERRPTRSSFSPHAPTKYIVCICEECGAQMSTMEEVREHRKEVHGNGRFLCDDCSVGFKTKNLLQQHQCLAEQSTLKVFDKLPRERKCKDTGCRKKIKLEVKNEPEFDQVDTLAILPSSSTSRSIDFQRATPKAPPPSHSLPSLDLRPDAKSTIAREHSDAATHTPFSDCTVTPRTPKLCRIVPNTRPSKRFSGAIRVAGERPPRQRRHPSLRPNPASFDQMVPRYCPQCALFLLMTVAVFDHHKAAHKIHPRLAIPVNALAYGCKAPAQQVTDASKAPAQVSHSARLPASTTKSMSKPAGIFGAAKKTIITWQGGKACKKQKHNTKISPAQATKKCSKKIRVASQLSFPREPLDAVPVDSLKQPSSSVSSASTSTTRATPSIHRTPSVPQSTSPPEVITLDDDEPAILLKIFKKQTIIKQLITKQRWQLDREKKM